MMLKFGFVWMGLPVNMPVGCQSVSLPPCARRTILDQLSHEYTNLHRRKDIHNPRHPSTKHAFLLFTLSPPRFYTHAIVLWVTIIPRRTAAIHLRLVLKRYCVLVRKRIWLPRVRVVDVCRRAILCGRLVRGIRIRGVDGIAAESSAACGLGWIGSVAKGRADGRDGMLRMVAGYRRQRPIVPVMRLPLGVAVVVVGRHGGQALVVVLGRREGAQRDAQCSRKNASCRRVQYRRGRLCRTMKLWGRRRVWPWLSWGACDDLSSPEQASRKPCVSPGVRSASRKYERGTRRTG